jgi:hypothetical protein
MKKAFFALLLIASCRLGIGQDIMTVLPDSTGREMFSDFLGIKLWAGDYKINTLNQDLTFRYVSVNNGFVMLHDLDVRNLNSMPNIGTGLEENLGSHLIIHFVDVSVGYGQNAWNWNIGGGIGYFLALDKKRNFRLRANLNLFYENISYGVGTYVDTTNLGFVVNGNNIGTYIKNVKYVNNSFCSSLGIGFMYRTNAFDYYADFSWSYVITNTQDINFYATRVNDYEAVYYQSGKPVYSTILNLGNYIIQVGIMREFGL